ncbi:MAG: transcription elongation factor GreB [Gammaproteobacteria bacterium]|nr:MAG: transcription elongation factor GreB [Gammaproteobacteria bacterium]
MTAEGYKRLDNELAALWLRRRDVVSALSAAAAEGDRSENAEYIYRKKELREIDSRVRYLQKRLPDLTVVSTVPDNQNQIFFGAWVELEDTEGKRVRYRIVGPDEFDQHNDYISLDSPMAKALLKRFLDDEILVKTPEGEAIFHVLSIFYKTRQ